MTEFRESIAKEEICKKFNEVSFRKFGNAFRKHIDEYFKAEYNLKSNGGRVYNNFPWSEAAWYIICDGDYALTEEQYEGFMSEFK